MKFYKNNLKIIIAFVVGLILSGGIVYAVTSANQISYTTDKNVNIKNVEEALNDLYSNTNIIYEKGEFNQYVAAREGIANVTINLEKTYTAEDNARLVVTDITQPNAMYFYSGVNNKIIGNQIGITLLNYAGDNSYSKTYNVKYSVIKCNE